MSSCPSLSSFIIPSVLPMLSLSRTSLPDVSFTSCGFAVLIPFDDGSQFFFKVFAPP